MSARILDGKKIAEQIRRELADKIATLRRRGIVPGLTAVLIGDDPASAAYVGSKVRMCEQLGLNSKVHRLERSTSEQQLLDLVAGLNHDDQTHGILVQLPLPEHIAVAKVLEAIAPIKDVDGFNPINRGRLQAGEATLPPCTPAGIIELLVRSGHEINGKHVVILGRSAIVGTPLALMLLQKHDKANATVTVCHSGTRNLELFASQADILIAAIGKSNFVQPQMVKPGAVVVDVGINRVSDAAAPKGYRLTGDVDFEAVQRRAAAISPVPGGVGPMTIAMLMCNTVRAAELTMH